jgi:hypothetical protein
VDEKPKIQSKITDGWIFRAELGAAMVDTALNGGGPRLMDNAMLRATGQAALEKVPA